MSEVKVNKISPRSGTTLTIGDSGDTTNVVGTLQNNGAALVGDISSVVAGTNLSGGGTSGDVTINLADASTSAKGAASFSSDNFAASSGAVTIKDAGIATAEIQDDAITLAKMAPGTDGNIISYDASGNPVAVATGSAGQVLTSAGAGAPPTFAAGGATLSGSTNNTVATVTGANALVGEANLTFDGSLLNVNGGSTNGNVLKTTTSGDNNYLAIDNTSTGGVEWVLNSSGNGSGNGGGNFAIQGPDSNTARVMVHSNGVTSFNNGIALGVGTANTASNVLDDYEEGTFTPGIKISNSTTGISLGTAAGHYTKIGNRAIVNMEIALSSKGSNTGNVSLINLPFTTSNDNYQTAYVYNDRVSSPNGDVQAYVLTNGTSINFYQTRTDGTNNGNLTGNEMNNTSYLIIFMTYKTA